MDGKQILGFVNYLMLALVFLFSLFSLIFKNQRRKITFLFLVFICLLLISFLFFSGNVFILSAIIIIIFSVLIVLIVNNQEYFAIKTISNVEGKDKVNNKDKVKDKLETSIILSLVFSIIAALFFSFLFINLTRNFYKELKFVETFNTVNIESIINDISTGFSGLIFLIIITLIGCFFWFIYMIENRKENQ